MLANRYIVVGQNCTPSVHILSPAEQAAYSDRLRAVKTDRGRLEAYRVTFRMDGAQYALPASCETALLDYAENYTGPHPVAVKAFAARLLLGMPLCDDPGNGPGNGPRVEPKPQPIKPRPGGAFAQLLTEAQA